MEVCCLASPLFKCELGGGETGDVGNTHQASERTATEQMELLKRLHKRATQFGTTNIRTFAYWRRGELTPQIEDAVAAGMTDAVKYAEDNGLMLLMENEHDCYLGTGVETARFLSQVQLTRFSGVLGPGQRLFRWRNAIPDRIRGN